MTNTTEAALREALPVIKAIVTTGIVESMDIPPLKRLLVALSQTTPASSTAGEEAVPVISESGIGRLRGLIAAHRITDPTHPQDCECHSCWLVKELG